jgi:hypothetical protein
LGGAGDGELPAAALSATQTIGAALQVIGYLAVYDLNLLRRLRAAGSLVCTSFIRFLASTSKTFFLMLW